jgi:hypothetical protein
MGGKNGYVHEKNRTEETKKRGEQKEEKEEKRQKERGKDTKEENCVNSKLKNTNRGRGNGKFAL